MSRRVAVIGVGQVPFTGRGSACAADLGAQAALAALEDAQISPGDVDFGSFGSAEDTASLGQKVLLRVGRNGIPTINQENACASGTTAIMTALRWIEAGAADVALAVGVDRFASRFARGPLPVERDHYGAQGLTLPAFYALLAQRHMATYGSRREDYAAIAAKNRTYAAENPFARFQTRVTVDEVLAEAPIATPLGRLDCCANGDGAAAVVLASAAAVRRASSIPVWIAGAAMASGEFGDRFDGDPMTNLSRLAYEAAGVGAKDVDVVECHDNFSPGELECYERLGFCPTGEGHLYLREGRSAINGSGAAWNPSGGLLGRSHPPGATGCAQVGSIARQLRDQAGALQHDGARVGLVHTSGGGVMELQSNATVVLLMKR